MRLITTTAIVAALSGCFNHAENTDLKSEEVPISELPREELACQTESGWYLKAVAGLQYVTLTFSKDAEQLSHSISISRSAGNDDNMNDVYALFGVEGQGYAAGGAGPVVSVSDNDVARDVQLFEAINSLPVEQISFEGSLTPNLEIESAKVGILHRQAELETTYFDALTCKGAPDYFMGVPVVEISDESSSISVTREGEYQDKLKIKIGDETTVLDASSFIHDLSVPDVEANTTDMIILPVAGKRFLGASVNPRTGKIAVAVRGFIYAETSFDMIFVLDSQDLTEMTYLPFGGAGASDNEPHTDVAYINYDDSGIINVQTRHPSSVSAKILYNPDLSLRDCVAEDVEDLGTPTDGYCPVR